MLARLRGMVRPRRGLVVIVAMLAASATASASWQLPGAGAGIAQASVDFHAPVVTAETVATQGVTAAGGAVAPGGSFVVYANVVDVGVSGVAWTKANVSNLETGATAVPLSPCSSGCTIAGTTYGWSSAVQTANAGLAQGTQSYGVWAKDNAGNVGALNSHTATVDGTRPTVSAAAVAMAAPATSGFVRSAATYYVYAKATDAGSPASGIAAVAADVSAVTSGQTAVPLPACTSSCTVGGVTYTYKSAPLTAGAGLPDGGKSFTVTATDVAGNATSTAYTATSDSTSPAVTAAAVVNTTPSVAGYAKPGGAYVVYANVTDANVSTVTANVSNLTAGQTAVALSACTSACTQGGVTYAYKSASQTAGASIAQGATAFSLAAADKAANTATGSFSATVDGTGPTVSGIALANTTTGAVALLKKSGAYIVYANASDPAGMGTVKANVASITSGQTALSLSACSSACTVGGVTYAYKSASKTAGSSLVAGPLSYTVTATDQAGNTATASPAVTVDDTAPTVAITFPTASYASGWSAGCGTPSTADVCGTASDASSGVAGVQLSLRQAASPNMYWSPTAGLFSSSTEVLMPATLALPSWSFPAAAAWFANGSAYTIRAVATDAAANTATTSTTFTFAP